MGAFQRPVSAADSIGGVGTGAVGGLASFKAASHELRTGFLVKGSLWKCIITPAALALYNSLLQPGVIQYEPP